MNIAIACGGTGGHLFPGLAVAEVLRERGHRALLFISEKEIDALAVRDHASSGDFRFEKLPSIGLPRVFSPAMLTFTRGMVASIRACRHIYQEFKPHAILGMGGFTSTAPLLAARIAGPPSPTFIHESNAIPGKANRLNARLARTVLLGFAECAEHFPRNTRCETTGTPIRASLRQAPPQREALASFGFDPSQDAVVKKTLLVMGGSQGARGLNRAVFAALPAWKNLPLRVLHFTGKDDEDEARAAYAASGLPAHVAAFCHEMGNAYAAADFAVARSGAASLSELAAFGLPAMLIPYPFAAEDHQTANARLFTRPGAAVMLRENESTGESLARILPELLQHPDKLHAMSAAMRALAPADAARLVVETIEKVVASPAAAGPVQL